MGWILLLEFCYAFTVIYQPLPLMGIIFHKSYIIFELPVCIQTVVVEPYRLLSTKLLGQEFLHLIFQNLLYEQQLEWSNLWWPFAIKWKLKHTTLSEHFIKTYHSVGTFHQNIPLCRNISKIQSKNSRITLYTIAHFPGMVQAHQ